MDLYFFRHNVSDIRRRLSESPDGIGFWYAPGLTSYKYINECIKVRSIFVDAEIEDDFAKDYPELVAQSNFSVINRDAPPLVAVNENAGICLLASSDTIIKTFYPVLREATFQYTVFCKPFEHAIEAASDLGMPARLAGYSIDNIKNYSALVLGNDWGLTENKINDDFLAAGVNTICLQESSIDFAPADRRMQNCGFPIYQGLSTIKSITHGRGSICAVIGNPRFQDLAFTPGPRKKMVMINVNFTYGVYEEVRDEWVAQVINACKAIGVPYVISQHPRDRGNYPDQPLVKSGPNVVHETLKKCSVLVSRFSALLTESVCLGRPAVYFNPHGEKMYYDYESDGEVLFHASTRDELIRALREALQLDLEQYTAGMRKFIDKHLGVTRDRKSVYYMELAIRDVSNFPALKTPTKWRRLRTQLAILKRKVFGQMH